MVIDPACSVVLEAEEEEDDVMQRPPRDPGSPLLLPKRIVRAVLQGLIVFAILAGVLISAARMGMPEPDLAGAGLHVPGPDEHGADFRSTARSNRRWFARF